MFWGAAEVTVIQFPETRFVDACNEKPWTSGHEKVRFVPAGEMNKAGGASGVALTDTLFALSPAMFNAETT